MSTNWQTSLTGLVILLTLAACGPSAVLSDDNLSAVATQSAKDVEIEALVTIESLLEIEPEPAFTAEQWIDEDGTAQSIWAADPYAREGAMASFISNWAESAHDDLHLLLTDPDPVIRQHTLDLIADSGNAEFLPLLELAETDVHPAVRQAAIEAIEALRAQMQDG